MSKLTGKHCIERRTFRGCWWVVLCCQRSWLILQ
ncbi:3'(2'),5'-bisphosphate nucleotidase 2 [Candida albicans L26]|nr:3'(2'),5'-bisphosphate nucleotidase 2 [Candida albicans P37005]KGT65972.1 3'(2'),5'-bisphosphate nucleotidase 2 [Candida albicans 12C]KGU05395.1 3'(2'),5'-bisphosphate nucleotidase 2 [Candida albicans 19F]KGU05869.1 3'(2'),5'-bisphosphate nucleotidase 2 [Candida albicans L26]KHC50275.1 3'(2'),5'-bisphosphate nucleotidase 2 [Candida albicans P37039]KHC73250.1 3'(2'),5'-bisphosphate nucleotidase 1 [Candida albicans SC5314]